MCISRADTGFEIEMEVSSGNQDTDEESPAPRELQCRTALLADPRAGQEEKVVCLLALLGMEVVGN